MSTEQIHLQFVTAAYVLVAVLLVGLVSWLWWQNHQVKRKLQQLESAQTDEARHE